MKHGIGFFTDLERKNDWNENNKYQGTFSRSYI